MNRYYIIYISLFLLAACLGGCKSARQVDAAYATYDFETRCLKCDGDRETVRAWGKGKDKGEALVQCRKQALRDILFKGITLGAQGCSPRPLITTVNAEEKNRAFFNDFFSDNGDWKRFALLDEKSGSRKVSKNSTIENWEASVTVDIDALGKYLQNKGLLQ